MNLSQIIINQLNELNDKRTVYVLKGFNYWLGKINSLDFLIPGKLDLSKPADTTQMVAALSKGDQPIFATYEDLLALENGSLGGLFQVYQKKVIVIENDFYDTYFPGGDDEDIARKVKKLYEQDNDNYIQNLYGDIQTSGKIEYVAYNDVVNIPVETVKISDLVIKSGQKISTSNQETLEIPEEYDEIVESGLVTQLLEGDYQKIDILEDLVNEDALNLRLGEKLRALGFEITTRTYAKESSTTSKIDHLDDYLEILRRKNAAFQFKELEVYANPYEDNQLTTVNQAQIIDDLVQNALKAQRKEFFRDIFVTAPTGAGKSVMFQIPAIYLAEKENLLTLVISPLIGLMNDQVNNIVSMTDCAATINSDYTPLEKEETLNKIKNGEKSILYLSPESLLSNTDITSLIGDRKIGLLVVDEAHIVATWGKSFRPDYWYLGDFINKLRTDARAGSNFPIATFTATSTFGGNDNMYQEIIESLKMTPVKYIGNVKRDDIKFDIRNLEKNHAYKEEKLKTAIDSINKLAETGDKTLVYCPYTAQIADLYIGLKHPEKAGQYYGKMMPSDKNAVLKDIHSGKKNLVLATKAFGMGIDIDDIKYVYHFAPTGTIPDYVQEIGRAARRPDMIGTAITDFYVEDFRYIKQLYGMSSIKNYQLVGVLKKIVHLYYHYNRRNFLVSPEEFSPIFADCRLEEIDNKLKTTLLMIRKDFEADPNLNYVPLIFKPRSMFVTGFFRIRSEFVPELEKAGYMKYFRKMELKKRYTKPTTDPLHSDITVTSVDDTYKLDFKKIWEDRFKDISFGTFKYQFFKNELSEFDFKVGTEVNPRLILQVKNPDGLRQTYQKLEKFLDTMEEILSDLRQENKFFDDQKLAEMMIAKKCFKKSHLSETVSHIFIRFLEKVESKSLVAQYFSDYNSATNKYRIKNTLYTNKIYNLKKAAKYFLDTEDTEAVRYAGRNTPSNELLVTQLVEVLEIGEGTIMSGENPEFFIRVNNLYALEKIINNPKYSSKTVFNVLQKHQESCELMEHFFTTLQSDTERWDFIEQYFLGKLSAKSVAGEEERG